MHVLDGILERDDVAVALAVNAVDDAGQRRGLARAGGAGDEHEALGQVGELEHAFGDVELGGVGEAEGDDADDGGHGAALAEDVGAETADAGEREREILVKIIVTGEVLEVTTGNLVDGLDHGARVRRREYLPVHAHLATACLVGERKARHHEDVRRLEVDHLLEQIRK